MGLFGVIGKMAGSKLAEKVEEELTKKQNQEQTSSYCNYIKANLARILKITVELESETKSLIDQISSLKGVKLSFREKVNFRKIKEKANKNLEYLYLVRDFFTVLAKNASGVILKNEELTLVTKFAPFFDGVPILDIEDDENSDDSLLGAFKEVEQELREAFISSKKGANYFDFDDYLYRYSEKIEEYVLPDIHSAIENFINSMAVQEASPTSLTATPVVVANPSIAAEEIECPNCHSKLNSNSKFCTECGNKIEMKQPSFCSKCGELVKPNSKFCANCGSKIS